MSGFWDTVEYILRVPTYVAVIAYVLYTLGWIKPFRPYKNEAPATFGETWRNTNSFLDNASKMMGNFQKALNDQTAEKKDL